MTITSNELNTVLKLIEETNKENSRIEVKSHWYRDSTNDKRHNAKVKNELAKDIISLANGTISTVGSKAYLIVGYDELKKEYVDVTFGGARKQDKSQNKLKDEITQLLINYVNKPLSFDVFFQTRDGKEIIIIGIEVHPYLFYLNKDLETPTKTFSKGSMLYRENSIIDIATQEVREEFEKVIKKTDFQDLYVDPKAVEQPEIKIDAEDILSLTISQRDIKSLSRNKGDFSKSEEVYYEYYTLERKGALEGYLFLGTKINNRNVFVDFQEIYSQEPSRHLEVFLVKQRDGQRIIDKKTDIIRKAKEHCSVDIEDDSIHYIDDFIWKFTIDESSLNTTYKRKDFVDQRVYRLSNSEKLELLPEKSIDFFLNRLNNPLASPFSVIVGSGGVGKTTFCDTLKYRIDQDEKLRKKVFYIKGERIVQFFLSDNKQVESLDDLYSLYREDVFEFNSITQEYFKLNFMVGNIIVIIDAIEEIESALTERFALEHFFDSLKSLHERFLSTKIIVTTREHFLPKIRSCESKIKVSYYQLQGFEKNDLNEFLNERYNNDSKEGISKIHEANKFINGNNLFQDEHIIPLFVDWVCQIIDRPERKKISLESEYLFQEEKIDKLLINLLQREIKKQSLNIDVDRMFQLLEEIVVEYNGSILKEEFDNSVRALTDQGSNNYIKNPLFKDIGDRVEIKYDVLANLVKSRSLHHSIINEFINEKVLDLLKDCYKGQGDTFIKLIDTLSTCRGALKPSLNKFLSKCRSDMKSEKLKESKKEKLRRAISALLYIAEKIEKPSDNKGRTALIQDLFDTKSVITGLCIYGDFGSLDFEGLVIQDSFFVEYLNFHKSAFSKEEKIIFFSTKFKDFDIPETKKIKSSHFDPTCEYINCNINEILLVNVSKEAKKIASLRKDIISIASYIDISQRSLNMIKQRCSVSYRKGTQKLLKELCDEGFLELDDKKSGDLYKLKSKFYDDIPSIKLDDFPVELEEIIERML